MHYVARTRASSAVLVAAALLADAASAAVGSAWLDIDIASCEFKEDGFEDGCSGWDLTIEGDSSNAKEGGLSSSGLSLIQFAAWKINRSALGKTTGRSQPAHVGGGEAFRSWPEVLPRGRHFRLLNFTEPQGASSPVHRVMVMVSVVSLVFCSSAMFLGGLYARMKTYQDDSPYGMSDQIFMQQAAADGLRKGSFDIAFGSLSSDALFRVDCEAFSEGGLALYDLHQPLSDAPRLRVEVHMGETSPRSYLPDDRKYYRIDNTRLKAQSRGLAYRGSMNPKDKIRNALAIWESVVLGRLVDNSWLQVGDQFLPTRVDGITVLKEVQCSQSEEARNMVIRSADNAIAGLILTHRAGSYSVVRTGKPELIIKTNVKGDELLEMRIGNGNGPLVASCIPAESEEATKEFLQLGVSLADWDPGFLILASLAALRHYSAWE